MKQKIKDYFGFFIAFLLFVSLCYLIYQGVTQKKIFFIDFLPIAVIGIVALVYVFATEKVEKNKEV